MELCNLNRTSNICTLSGEKLEGPGRVSTASTKIYVPGRKTWETKSAKYIKYNSDSQIKIPLQNIANPVHRHRINHLLVTWGQIAVNELLLRHIRRRVHPL